MFGFNNWYGWEYPLLKRQSEKEREQVYGAEGE